MLPGTRREYVSRLLTVRADHFIIVGFTDSQPVLSGPPVVNAVHTTQGQDAG